MVANGEKKILWRLLELLIAFAIVAFALATGVNGWVIRDYWQHKSRAAARSAQLDERLAWQEATLRAIALKLEIEVPAPPARPHEPVE